MRRLANHRNDPNANLPADIPKTTVLAARGSNEYTARIAWSRTWVMGSGISIMLKGNTTRQQSKASKQARLCFETIVPKVMRR
jgi:hypothetical protein